MGVQQLPQLRLRIGLLDIALFIVVLLMFLTQETDIFFHSIFILLTLGAFIWQFRSFVVRSYIWVTITTIAVILAVMDGWAIYEDLIELALLCVILAIVFVITNRRAQAQTALAATLAAEQEHAKRLRELAVLKADFTAMVAHELGSPLLAIRGFADMLATGRLNAETQGQVIDAIRTEVHMLNALVADVQTAAAVERDDFGVHPRPVAVSVLLNDAAAYAKTLSDQHPVKVDLSSDHIVLADPERIGQVLRNLLSNAAKYSPAGSPITLRAVLQGTHMQIAVIDQGPGIHPDDTTRIFEKFGRGHNPSNQKVAGAGLGLYLSHRIVHAHGSDLVVTSTLGQGAAFSFLLKVTS